MPWHCRCSSSRAVDYIIGLSMGLAVMLGAYFGAGTAIKGGAKFIRPVFITVVLGLTVRLAAALVRGRLNARPDTPR